MTIDQLVEVHAARPFQPYTSRLTDGSAVRIPHPEVLWFHPRGGRTVFAAGPKENVRIIDLFLVTSTDLGNGRSTRRRKA